MTKLAWKPWHQVVQLRDDLKSGELSDPSKNDKFGRELTQAI